MFALSVSLLVIISVFISSCKKEEAPLPEPEASSIQSVSGNSQSAEVDQTLTNPIEVVVKDKDGKVFSGTTVSFSVTEGSVSPTSAKTDASGTAKTSWTLGPTEGTQSLIVTAFKADGKTELSGSPVTFTATATMKKATSIELVAGGDQTADVETVLANSIVVLVKDQNGDAFAGEVVNFTVAEGSVSSASGTTGVNGNASVSWTLGSTAGTQTLTVSAFQADATTHLTGSPLTVNATAVEISLPTITTSDAGSITETSGVLGGNVTDDGNATVTERGIYWGTSSNPETTGTKLTIGNGIGSFSTDLTGLTAGTTYFIKAYAINSMGEALGSEVSFTTDSGSGNETGTVTDFDGNTYSTVKLGEQWWMAENLATTKYNDGTEIPLVTDNAAWASLDDNNTDDAYCYYDNESNSQYGALYTYAAALEACPAGWHLPSDGEWKQLEVYLGMSQVNADETGYRGTNEGSKLAGNSELWNYTPIENDVAFGTSGFVALPGGVRNYYYGTFFFAGEYGYWWSSTESLSTYAYYRYLFNGLTNVYRNLGSKSDGYSVRCVKD